MADLEKEEVVKQDEPKKTEKSAKKDKKQNGGMFRALKTEYKRIVWPDKQTVTKESTAVVVATVILGAVIALLDWVIKYGLDKIFQLG